MLLRCLTFATAAVLALGSDASSQGRGPVVRVTGGDCASIQRAIDSLPAGGGEVVVEAGTYVCATYVSIDRDFVTLRGEGPATRLRLADGADSPVLVIGSPAAVPGAARGFIHVADLMVDGNKGNQTKDTECYRGACSDTNRLRNNGVSLRNASDVTLENISAFDAASGGVVAELGSRRLVVRGLRAWANKYDGLAGYNTEDSVFTGLQIWNNGAAGMSLDNGFINNQFSDVVIFGSGTSGIFMRDVRENTFTNVRIRNVGEDGIFCAEDDVNRNGRCIGNTFVGLVVSQAGRAGIRVNNDSCVHNLVTGAQFIANAGGCLSESSRGLIQSSGVICR